MHRYVLRAGKMRSCIRLGVPWNRGVPSLFTLGSKQHNSFVAQRFGRLEARGPVRRKVAEQQAGG